MSRTLRLKVPKPRSCLGCIDLQTATEVITIFTLINKVSGFYGILSLFTGTSEREVLLLTFRRPNIGITIEHVYMVYNRYHCLLMGVETDQGRNSICLHLCLC